MKGRIVYRKKLPAFDEEEILVLLDWAQLHCKECLGLRCAIALHMQYTTSVSKDILVRAIQVLGPDELIWEEFIGELFDKLVPECAPMIHVPMPATALVLNRSVMPMHESVMPMHEPIEPPGHLAPFQFQPYQQVEMEVRFSMTHHDAAIFNSIVGGDGRVSITNANAIKTRVHEYELESDYDETIEDQDE